MITIFEKTRGEWVDVDYETGCHFMIEYVSEAELKWTALAKVDEGARGKRAQLLHKGTLTVLE